ncbi:MAG: AsmA family protein [Marinilabiliales bacterium]|nr:AsmA family protein [Marinilabiliales bacterium]
MKKKLTILASLILVVVLMLFGLPVLFKGKIVNSIKDMANQRITAKLDFGEADISLIRSFPQFSVRIKDFSLTGTGEFEGKKLLEIKELKTLIAFSSLWNSKGIQISELSLDQPSLHLLVSQTGKENWSITKTSATAAPSGQGSSMQLDLSRINLTASRFEYQDQQAHRLFSLANGNFTLSGSLKGSESKLTFDGQADSLKFLNNETMLLSGLPVSGSGTLQANFDTFSFRFLENKFLISKLPLMLDGTFTMQDQADLYDLTFQSPGASLEHLISLLPPAQQARLKGFEKSGTVSFAGKIQGKYTDQDFPSIQAKMELNGGQLKYPSLPQSISGINLIASLTKPEGSLDSAKLTIQKLEATVAGHPFIANLLIDHPVSRPNLAGEIIGEVDFSSLKQALPMDAMEIGGMMRANLHFNGAVESIEKGNYDQFKTSGTVALSDFFYRSPLFPDRLGIQSSALAFDSREIRIASFRGSLGNSDFNAEGSLSESWGYLLRNGILKGNLKLKSDKLDITQLMNGGRPSADTTLHSDPYVLPERMDITLQAEANSVVYNRMDIKGTTGKINLKDGILNLDQLSMNLLKGKMVVSGSYQGKEKSPADFHFKLDLKDIDLPSAHQSIAIVRHLLPLAASSKGLLVSSLTLDGKLGRDYAPDFAFLNGSGSLGLKNIELTGTNLFNEIGKYFRKELFTNVKVNDFSSNVSITNGALSISPFTTKIANQEVTVSGSQNLALDLNYVLNFQVNRNDLSTDVTGLIGVIPGAQNIEKYPVKIMIGGNIKKPDVKVDLSEAKDLVAKEFSKKAKSTLQDAVKKFGLDKLFK